MTGSARTGADLDARRRRALYRAWHRGTREMDLLMGRFADAEIGAMSDAELAEFEVLMEAPDPDLLAWLMDQREVPIDQDTPILRRLKAFHTHAAPMDL